MMDIIQNLQYLILIRNVRVVGLIEVLARRMNLNHLHDAYRKITAKLYQTIIPEYLRVRSHVLPRQHLRIYLRKK